MFYGKSIGFWGTDKVEGSCSSLKEKSRPDNPSILVSQDFTMSMKVTSCLNFPIIFHSCLNPQNAADLTKDYKCSLGIEFPKTEDEKKLLLFNIESVVKSVTGSVIDLDFLRTEVLEKHKEEIQSMDFVTLTTMDLETLPSSNLD